MSAAEDDGTTPAVVIKGQPLWAQMPDELLRDVGDEGVSDAAVRLWGLLARRGRTPDRCFPSTAVLAAEMGKTDRSVRTYLAELVGRGWLERVARFRADGEQTSNGYVLWMTRQETSGGRKDSSPPGRKDSSGVGRKQASPQEREQDEREPVEREEETSSTDVEDPPRAALALVPPSATPDRRALAAKAFTETFWPAYPKKVGKQAALKRWHGLTADQRRDAIEALPRYLEVCRRIERPVRDPVRYLADEWYRSDFESLAGVSSPAAKARRGLSREEQRIENSRSAAEAFLQRSDP